MLLHICALLDLPVSGPVVDDLGGIGPESEGRLRQQCYIPSTACRVQVRMLTIEGWR
jgi:hypothetical protein